MILRVAGAQIPVTTDIDSNLNHITGSIEFARAESADVLITPEGSLSGYTPRFDETKTVAALREVTALAKEAGIGLALGTCFTEPGDGLCYNQLRFYEKSGEYLGFHSKTLRCGSLTDPPKGEIEHYAVGPLRTFALQGVTVGGLICNDLWANPGCTPGPDTHLTQQLADMGARIVFHAVNGGRNGSDWARDVVWPYHETNLRMRAQSGKLFIVTVDNAEPVDIPCSAPSGICGPDGNWIVKAPDTGKQFFVGDFEING